MAFRKRRVATPGYGHTPYNPLAGDQANLRQDGTSPHCAMVQIASADVYDDYVICRGFDPRILKFIDYASGDSSKPGICVAKPFGKRRPGTYEVAEVYPAFLPTQGNANFQDFRQVVYTPPSPSAVHWRVGQNPGVVTGGLDGGQPDQLTDTIGILYDHNGKVVNWLLIDSNSGVDHYLFTMLEDMGMSDGAAEIRSMDDATQIDASADVKNTLSDFSHLKSGDRGICVKVDGVYYAVHPEGAGQSGGVVFNLTSNLAASVGSTATATVIVSGVDGVPAPSSITVYNTGKKKSWTGALGWAVLIGNQFWVAEVDQYPIRSVVVLSADTHTFSPGATYQGRVDTQKATPVSVSSMVATTTYPFAFIPSPLPAITNPLNLIGLSGDKGLVTYNEDADEFQLAEIYPQEKRRVAFKLTGNMPNVTVASTIAYAPTEPREFTSGEMPHLPSPPTDPIYDPLKLIVDGRIDDQGVIEYSYRAGQWHVTAFRRREFGSIQFQIMTVITKSGGPFAGLKAATGRVKLCHPDRASLLDTVVEIIDHSGCVFDLPEEDLIDVWAWATERIKTDGGGATTIHWAADDRCCTPADGGGGGGGGGGDIDGGAP